MKKFLLSLIALPMLAMGVTSCSDDNDSLPEVKMEVKISGGVQSETDNKIYAQTITAPFGAEIDTEGMTPGEYTLQIKTEVYQVDKSAAFILLTYTMVVEPDSPSDDPDQTPGESIANPDLQEIAEQ